MQNLFLFSAEYQSGMIIYRDIILYFVSYISLFPVNPWRWLTVKMERGGIIFIFNFIYFILGEENKNMGSKAEWAGFKQVNWFPWSGKSGDEQGQGFWKYPRLCCRKWQVPRLVYLDKVKYRHWNFLPWWIFSCSKNDMQAELTSSNCLDWDNGHLSSQLGTHRLISSRISHTSNLYWAL